MDTIYKQPADELFSGSFITAGEALCQVIHVGADNYIAKSTKKPNHQTTKYLIQGSFKQNHSLDQSDLVPLCTLLFVKQFYFSHATFNTAILRTVAAAVGMFPKVCFYWRGHVDHQCRLSGVKVMVQGIELHWCLWHGSMFFA